MKKTISVVSLLVGGDKSRKNENQKLSSYLSRKLSMERKIVHSVSDEPMQVREVTLDKKKFMRSRRIKAERETREGLEALEEGYHSEMRIEYLSHDDFIPGKTNLSGMFAVEVTNDKYEDQKTGSLKGTLYSPEMGSLHGVGDQSDVCIVDKCGLTKEKCNGHFGYITLPKGKYILNPLTVKELVKLLNCMCILDTHVPENRLYNNHDELREKGVMNMPPTSRISFISNISTKVCLSCHGGAVDKKVKFEMSKSGDGILKYKIGTSLAVHRLKPNKINKFLFNLREEELELLGLSSNSNNPHVNTQQYTISCIAVPPIALRMPKISNGKKVHDDITVKLSDIITKKNSWNVSVTNDRLTKELSRLGLSRGDTEAEVQQELNELQKDMEADKSYALKTNTTQSKRDLLSRREKLEELQSKITFLSENKEALTSIGKRGASGGGSTELQKALFLAVKTHFNEIGNIYQSKNGLVRDQMLGKRSGHTARAVIVPAVQCALDEIEVPSYIAEKTGVPDVVGDNNILFLQKMMEEGKIIEYKFSNSDVPIQVTNQRITEGHCRLKIGDTVLRKLMNGDVVLIGRQPTIHKGNFMAFRARIVDRKSSAGIPFAITVPLAGDFDGDTIHMYFPQTIEARREALSNMYVLKNIIGGRNGAPIISLEYGALKIWNVATDENAPPMTRDNFNDIYFDSFVNLNISYETDIHYKELLEDDSETYYRPFDSLESRKNHFDRCKKHGVSDYSPRSLFSVLLPPDFIYPPGGKPSRGDKLLILDGILVSGTLGKKHLGANVSGTITHFLHKDYGWKTAADFIQRCYRMADRLHDMYAFTFGHTDAFVGLEDEIKEHYDRTHEEMERRISSLGPIPNDPYSIAAYEQTVRNIISMVEGEKSKSLIEERSTRTNIWTGWASALSMGKRSGTKGSITEAMKTFGSYGQLNITGERPKETMSQESRCLANIRPGDRSIEARGYSRRGLAVGGLDPTITYVGFQSVRDDQGANALKTPISGDIARSLVMTLQNYKTENGMVVFRGGLISDTIAGLDGFNGERLIAVDGKLFFFHPVSLADKVNNSFGWSKGSNGKWQHKTTINGEECYVEY